MTPTHKQIVLGIGANLSGDFACPRAACGAALEALGEGGLRIVERAPWYESAPVPVSDQPWYVNTVVFIETTQGPAELMAVLLETEEAMGRVRSIRNAPRVIDLDLLAFGKQVVETEQLTLPHPRMHERAFVVLPWRDLAPDWQHPVIGQTIQQLAEQLPAGQEIRRMMDGDGLFGTEWPGKIA